MAVHERLRDILEEAVAVNASDIHFVPGRQTFLRIHGDLRRYGTDRLTSDETRRMVYSILPPQMIERFEVEQELDASVDVEGLARFRINLFVQKEGIGSVFRVIPAAIPHPEDITLEDSIMRLVNIPRGLVLVTGPTGSGKSTTLACMLNLINREKNLHILTLEDPIEYVFPTARCVVTQREIGSHSRSFQESLRRALRQDPDVILVGEMRDLETISAVLTLAETGHLVFATLHTTDAAQTVDRIIDVFPPYQQQQIRTQLASTLTAVICQQLVQRADLTGRVAAREIMMVTPAVENLIREGKTHQIYSAIELGQKSGMKSLDRALIDLALRGVITNDAAIGKAADASTVEKFLHQRETRENE